MKTRSIQNALIGILALLSVAYYLRTTTGELGNTKFDDAYMITRYAKHWLDGKGFSWNPIDGAAYGITSPAYLFLITAILGLTGCSDGMALTTTSYTAGLLSALTLILMGFLVQRGESSRKSLLPLLVVPCLLLVPPFRYHSLTGMETTFSLLANSLLACSIVIATRKRSTAALLLCLLTGLLSYATRPDNGLYALLLPPLFFVATNRSLWRYALRYEVLFSLVVGLSLIVNRILFADFVPLPFFAKAGGFYQGYTGTTTWNAMKEMLVFHNAAMPCLIVLVSTTSRKVVPRLVAIGVVVIATFGYFATVTQIMGWQARYYYPSIAFVFLAAFTAISPGDSATVKTPIRASHSAFTWRLLVGVAILLPILSSTINHAAVHLWRKYVIGTPVAIHANTQYRKLNNATLPPLGWWGSTIAMDALLERMPQHIVFAASEYGWLGSRFPHLTIVDLAGLHDRTIAHQGFSAAYVLSRKPDLIWLPHTEYTYAVAELLDDPTFQRDYEYYPEAYDYGIALRKNSEFYAAMKAEANREFSRIYPGLNMSDHLAESGHPD